MLALTLHMNWIVFIPKNVCIIIIPLADWDIPYILPIIYNAISDIINNSMIAEFIYNDIHVTYIIAYTIPYNCIRSYYKTLPITERLVFI